MMKEVRNYRFSRYSKNFQPLLIGSREEADNSSIVQQTKSFDQFPGISTKIHPNSFGSKIVEEGLAKDPSYLEALTKQVPTQQIKNISMSESRAIKWSSVGKGIFYNPQIIIGNGRSSTVFEGKIDIRSQPLSFDTK
jgi:hypothetical protein